MPARSVEIAFTGSLVLALAAGRLAASAEDALVMLASAPFDVVITDIELPSGMRGLELTQLIKRDYRSDVIVMTGYSSDYSYEEAIRLGASDFIIKPFRTEELLLRIRRVLRERELTEERNRMMEKLQKLAETHGEVFPPKPKTPVAPAAARHRRAAETATEAHLRRRAARWAVPCNTRRASPTARRTGASCPDRSRSTRPGPVAAGRS